MPRPRKEKGGVDLRRSPDIVFRKLGREQAHGLATHPMFAELTPIDTPRIDLDTDTKGRKRLEVAIHEAMHIAMPALPESIVTFSSRYIGKVVWSLGYRADEDWQEKTFSLAALKEKTG